MSKFNNFNFKNQTVLVRVDFNVPLNETQEVTDVTRIKAAVPTIQHILNNGGAVVLLSHLGRPKGVVSKTLSLCHIVPAIEKELGQSIQYVDESVGEKAKESVKKLSSGKVLLLENIRFHKGETKGDAELAQRIFALGANVYVNDAFGTAHRAHASTTVVASYFDPKSKMFGLLMEQEINMATKIVSAYKSPFLAILGGAKVSDKIKIIHNLLPKVDEMIIGGGMAYTFLKAKGYSIGMSLLEEERIQDVLEIYEQAKKLKVKIHIPVDSVCALKFSDDSPYRIYEGNMPDNFMGLDIGPNSIEEFKTVIAKAKTILWNGPMGVFEFENFKEGTVSIAKAVADATINGAFSLVGGGDSVAAVKSFELQDQISHISTGGGALLEFFEGKTLPGIAAILDEKQL